MKRIVYLGIGLTAIAVGFWFFKTLRASAQGDGSQPASPELQRQVAAQEQRAKEYQQLLVAQEARSKREDQLLDQEEKIHQQALVLWAEQAQIMKKETGFLKRYQVDADRYEKILDTWESEQQQYQKYLDSLKK